MSYEKTYLRYSVVPLYQNLKGGSKNFDVFDKTPNFGSEKSFQLRTRIINFDDINHNYSNNDYDLFSKVSTKPSRNVTIYPQYGLILPRIGVNFKRVGEYNNNSTSKFVILTEDRKEIKNLAQELITLDRELEKIKGDEHESIIENLKKRFKNQSGGVRKINKDSKEYKFYIGQLEYDWENYLKRMKRRDKTPKSKEEFTKKWWMERKIIVTTLGTMMGLKLGQLPAWLGVAAGATTGMTTGAFTALLVAPIIGMAAVGLIISYLLIKRKQNRLNPKETKELLRKEIKERKDELKKLKSK